MNRIFKRVWSASRGAYVVVAETARSAGKTSCGVSGTLIASVLLSTGAAAQAIAAGALPTGGQVTAGQANISTQGAVMSVQQSSQRAAINWQSFNIGSGATVNFQQPSSSAVTLNRVVGTERSVIDGALNANGNVYILNANGVLFNRSAQVNVGGLVASTLNISDADFMAGKTTFESNGSRGSVINLGTLTAANAGHIALLGQHVANEGVINATLGTAVLAAGDKVSLNFNGNSLVGVTVDRGTLNALVENKQAIIADGGLVTLTAKGLDQVMQTVVNNTGEIRAQTIQNKEGKIYLLGGMQNDRIEAGGKLDASAPNSGNGGFVETSAANVQIKDDLHVTTQAARGRTGTWLIDPNDYTVAASGGNITGATLGTQLGTNNVEISTAVSGTSGGNGDIFVNDNITWSSGNRLTLTAERNIKINATIDASGGSGGAVTLNYGQGSVATGNAATYDFGLTSTGFAGKINLQAGQNFTTKLGSDGTPINWTVITQLGSAGDETQAGASNSLQGLAENSRLAGNFVLGADINASATDGWNSGQGFKPIGDSTTRFTGGFDGLGHTVDGLTINATGQHGINVGLFGAVGNTTLKNLGFSNIDIRTGLGSVSTGSGSLAGEALNTHIENIILKGHADTNNFTLKREGVTEFAQPFENFGGVVGIYRIDNSSNSSIGIRNVRVNANFTLGFEGYPLSSDWGFFRYIGGVVGRGFSDFVTPVNISNASFNGSIISNTQLGFSDVGGIIGRSNYLVLNDATVQADILNRENINWTSRFVGGAVGNLNPPGNGKRHTISRVSVSGAIRATEDVGGMLGAVNDADISNSHSSAVITNPYSNEKAGGLVGYGLNLSINQSSASGDVTGGSSKIGGLVGQLSTSSVIGSFATGNVSTSQSDSRAAMGGLIGEAAREVIVSNSFATGSVLPRQTNPGNAGRVGGLIGEINLGVVGGQTLIENSYATGQVGMPQRAFGDGVGGLIGLVTGQSTASVSVSNSSFRGADVHGRDQVGGLVGRVEINTQINNAYSDANVVGRDNVGGLIGAITWRRSGENHLVGINRSRSSGVVAGRDYVGGLLGKAANVNISESFATGNVSGQNYVGGFAGEIATAYQETTNYTDVYGIDSAYPAVASSVKNSYATGSVSATGSKSGGFTGSLYYGTLENVYAAGAVTGTSDVGGLVGTATYDTPVGEQYGTYYGNGQPVACSTIPAGSCYYQYFQQTGTQATLANNLVTGGFWDVEISGLGTINSTTGSAGGVGKSTTQMQRTTLFSNADWSVTTPIPGAQSPTLLWLNGQNSPVWQTYSAPISIVGTSVASKEYDGNTNASVTAGTLNGIVSGDVVSVSIVSASFANANAGSSKPVAVSYSLGGVNASDYHLPAGSATGTITPKALTVAGTTVANKTYDGTTTATVTAGTVSGMVGSEAAPTVTTSGTFNNANAGSGKSVTVTYTLSDPNYSLAGETKLADILAKALSISGTTVANKTYDGTTAATVTAGTLNGVVQGDAAPTVTASGTFNNANAGSGKSVTVTYTLSDPNYSLAGETKLADILAKALSISGTTVANKTYDGTTAATVTAGTLNGVVQGDAAPTVTASGTFNNANAASGKSVTVTYTLSDPNYSLAGETKLADILAKALSISGTTVANKTYDGTTAATVTAGTLNGVVQGDAAPTVTASGTFNNANAGTSKSVTVTYTLSDSNYSLAGETKLADILAKALSISGTMVANKTYDGTTAATVTAGTLNGVVQGDAAPTVTASGTFNNANAASGKSVTVTYTLSDPNYSLAGETKLADVLAKVLSISGTMVANKVYDGNTNANVSPGTLSGLVGDETLVVAADGELDNPNPGLRTALVRYKLSNGSNGGLASNYSLADTSGLTATVIQDSAVTNAAASIATPRLLTPESGQTGGKTSDVLLPASYVVNTAARINAGTAQSAPGNVVAVPSTVSLPFAQGEPLAVLSTPKSDEPTTPVTLSQARVMTGGQGSGVSDGTREVRVPVSRNSLAEIVNGGVKLPGGVEQQLFVVRK